MRQVNDNIIPVQTAAMISSTATPFLNPVRCSAQIASKKVD